MNLFKLCSKIIEYSFYSLFFLVPLTFTDKTSELFEFNKMWVTFGFTIVIVTAWLTKMIAQKRILFTRTPLDIPIGLFLLSQFVSTLFSMDPHVSIWGYYSRFNGGLLSTIAYILLFHAFLSNFVTHERHEFDHKKHETRFSDFRENIRDFGERGATKIVKRLLLLSLLSGTVVAVWGLPSHFGYDPTCLLFRGTLDVSCWTDAFQPKVRIFSTLGQPNWLAAYLSILIPIAITFALKIFPSSINPQERNQKSKIKNQKYLILASSYLILTFLFYLDLIYTNSQSGYIGFFISIVFMTVSIFYINFKNKLLPRSGIWFRQTILNSPFSILILFILIAFLVGQPINSLNKFTLPQLLQNAGKQTTQTTKPAQPQGPALEVGGTNSGKIRLIVWNGAINIWKNSPIFGSGVETFAFAYYKFRPATHNMTSEWDYLYNKAHNEYLNYLATTGIFGLGSYLAMIGWFLWLVLTKITKFNEKHETNASHFRDFREKIRDFSENKDSISHQNLLFSLALLSGYIAILVSNFFGFSVVIVNLYFFLIPAFVFVLNNQIHVETQDLASLQKKGKTSALNSPLSIFQWIAISLLILTSLYFILTLFRFWSADASYALGNNYNKVGQYENAYIKLQEAVEKRSSEPTFRDELAYNNAALSMLYLEKKDATTAAELIKRSTKLSEEVVTKHPNNIVFWKTRTRIFYLLGQLDPQYLGFALSAIAKANTLAPTDAKIAYNLGVLYGQTGKFEEAIKTLEETVKLKPDYRDAYYALGLFYREAAIDKDQKVVKPEMQKKAIDTMNYILTNFSKDDKQALESLEKWK